MMKAVVFAIYFIINFLFLLKYGTRQERIPFFILALLFIAINGVFYFDSLRFISKIKLSSRMLGVLIIFGGIIYVFLSHLMKDPYALNIDRWQTAEYSLDYWLHGKYIYSQRNFMGNVPSYLPGQLLFLVFFYLVGNIGYLQVVSFLFFCMTLIKEFKNNSIRLFGLLILFFSLSFVYEVVCKSDFISSFIIASCFIVYWHRKYEGNYFKKPILLGCVLGVLLLTRTVVVIPVILFLCKPFFMASTKEKIKTVLSFLAVFSILIFSVLFPAGSFNFILNHNPLGMQGQSNGFVVLFFLLLAFALSFMIIKIEHLFYISTLLIFSLMATHIIEQILRNTALNYLNITYLAAALPFAVLSLCFLAQKDDAAH